MPKLTVHKGRRYQAQISLSFLQKFVSNDKIARRFTESGFSEVVISGRGARRVATGLWASEDATAEVPPQVSEIVELQVA
jgi:hypothetical protein